MQDEYNPGSGVASTFHLRDFPTDSSANVNAKDQKATDDMHKQFNQARAADGHTSLGTGNQKGQGGPLPNIK